MLLSYKNKVDGSGRPPDNINARKRLSVIAWPEVLQIVTIFGLSYFPLMCQFWLNEKLTLLLSHLSIISSLYGSITKIAYIKNSGATHGIDPRSNPPTIGK